MPMNQPESVQTSCEQLRKFLNLGPLDDVGAANEAERLVTKISERAPPGSDAARLAVELTGQLHGWFTGQAPSNREAIARMRGELASPH
jgi:hypothetical protein